MSDYRGIAGITGALQQLVQAPVSRAVPGTSVRTGPPTNGSLAGGPGLVNIFLYQVTPNPQLRNSDLPTRRNDGSLIRRPQTALDLSYLISFFGEESKMVPQLLLGATVAAMHAQPVLTAEDIPEKLYGRSLADSGLPEQAGLAQFRAVPLSHEELSRIWSVFFQVPYALSVAYTCSVVLIEADLTPEPALPARDLRFGAFPGGPPVIDRVTPAALEPGPGAAIRLEGRGLGSRGTVVRFAGGIEVEPRVGPDGALEVALPPDLRPGVQAVYALRQPAGEGLTAHRGRSEPATFALLPQIAEPIAVGEQTLRVRSVSPVGRRQPARLHLYERTGGGQRPGSVSLRARPRQEQGDWLEFERAGTASGTYLAALEIDGLVSRLESGPDPERPELDTYVAPEVSLP